MLRECGHDAATVLDQGMAGHPEKRFGAAWPVLSIDPKGRCPGSSRCTPWRPLSRRLGHGRAIDKAHRAISPYYPRQAPQILSSNCAHLSAVWAMLGLPQKGADKNDVRAPPRGAHPAVAHRALGGVHSSGPGLDFCWRHVIECLSPSALAMTGAIHRRCTTRRNHRASSGLEPGGRLDLAGHPVVDALGVVLDVFIDGFLVGAFLGVVHA